LIAVVCVLLGCANGDGDPSVQTELNRLLATRWASYASARPGWKGGVAAYVITPRGESFASADLGRDVADDVHFRGASTTKLFTASAIMLLHQQGRLDIDDVVTARIPGASEPYLRDTADYAIPYREQITIRALLGHRAGVFDAANTPVPATSPFPYAGERYPLSVKDRDDAHTFTIDELVGVVAVNHLSYFPPDTDYHYSDTGYSLLGKIIERVPGRRYDPFVQENLLAPVGLSDTTFPHLGDDRACRRRPRRRTRTSWASRTTSPTIRSWSTCRRWSPTATSSPRRSTSRRGYTRCSPARSASRRRPSR
jgi:D-alanyl-D-alanine carboxypeptidase